MKQNFAKVTIAFPGCPDGERKTRMFKPGDTITGELAVVAVVNGWAEFEGQTKARAAAPENKAKDGTFRGSDGGDTGERSKPKRGGSGSRKKATSGKA